MILFLRFLALIVATIALCSCSDRTEATRGPTVLAAASLQEALTDAAEVWSQSGKARPALSFAGTPAIVRQVENGAPADIVVTADEEWMDRIGELGFVKSGSRIKLAGNSLVLVSNTDFQSPISLEDPASLRAALGGGRLALADPESVPAGRYAKDALEALGLWKAVGDRLAPTESVRAALALVERRSAPLGIVYASDAAISPTTKVVATFPASSHRPITYPAAIIADSNHPEASTFLTFLASPQGQEIFARHHFEAAP